MFCISSVKTNWKKISLHHPLFNVNWNKEFSKNQEPIIHIEKHKTETLWVN